MKPSPQAKSRREFLKTTAAAAVVTGNTVRETAAAADPLPVVPFGRTQVTRLIVGANPFYGYSHFNPRRLERYLVMISYYEKRQKDRAFGKLVKSVQKSKKGQ